MKDEKDLHAHVLRENVGQDSEEKKDNGTKSLRKQEGMAPREISLRLEEGKGKKRSREEDPAISKEIITIPLQNYIFLSRNINET